MNATFAFYCYDHDGVNHKFLIRAKDEDDAWDIFDIMFSGQWICDQMIRED